MPTTRLYIAAHLLIAESLRSSLQNHFVVAGTGSATGDVLERLTLAHATVLLLECEAGGPECLHRVAKLREAMPGLRVVLLAQEFSPFTLARIRGLGVAGCVLKQQSLADLSAAIRQAENGATYLSPMLHRSVDRVHGRGVLTPRQSEVLHLLAAGRTSRDIAALLAISVKTVEFHRSCLMRQLGLYSVAELARFAMQNGVVGPVA